MNKRSSFQNCCAACVLVDGGSGLAQIRSGTLVGKVVDPTGAPVPEAAVKVVAVETNSNFRDWQEEET